MKTDLHTTELTRDPAGSLRELLRVSVPLVISAGSTAMMYVIDRAMLSWYSVDAMGAGLAAGVLHWNLAALALGTVAYGNAFIGQYEGAGQHHRVGPVVWQGIYISLFAAALVTLCVPFAPAIFAWFGHAEAIQDFERRYFNLMCFATLPLLLDTALSCFFSGRGRTLVVMVVNVIGMLINAVLDYLLILGKAGFPRMGIEGAALATGIAFTCITLMYAGIILVTQRRASPYRMWAGRGFDRELFLRMLRFGLPTGVQQFLDIACWTTFVQLVGRLGTQELSATSLIFNLNGWVFIPLLGLGTAVTVLVGHRIGDGRVHLAVRTTWLAFAVATVYTAVFCAVYLFAPEFIMRPYGITENGPLYSQVVFILRLVAVYCWFDTMVVVFGSAIRGAGDTRFAMVLSVSLGLVLLVLPTSLAMRLEDQAFVTAWYAVTVFVTVLGLAFLARFQQGAWKKMRVIEHTLPELLAEAVEEPEAVAT